jgi:hypothetical protein
MKLFKKLDQFIFLKLDLLKNENGLQQFNDLKANLNEQQQNTIAQVIVFSIIIIPFLISSFLWYGNSQLKKNIELKKQILEQISVLTNNRDSLNNTSNLYVSSGAFTSKEDIDNKVRNLFSAKGIDQSKVTILDFNLISSNSAISKIETNIHFENFGTQDFSNFLNTMIDAQKFKVQKISLTKNKDNELLQGDVTLMHIGRNNQMQ